MMSTKLASTDCWNQLRLTSERLDESGTDGFAGGLHERRPFEHDDDHLGLLNGRHDDVAFERGAWAPFRQSDALAKAC